MHLHILELSPIMLSYVISIAVYGTFLVLVILYFRKNPPGK